MKTHPEGAFHHIPVLAGEVLTYLKPQPGGIYLDATLGGGGHSQLILTSISENIKVIGLDRDPRALQAASRRLAPFGSRFQPLDGKFSELARLMDEAGIPKIDGALADLGVSSPQLDDPTRGFSFQKDGPLDMRMNPREGSSAADFVNSASTEILESILQGLGEERYARRIARAIVRRRKEAPFERTRDLAEVIAGVIPGPRGRIHPATRSFQAIRMHINQELEELETGLETIRRRLKVGGRMVVISFHSGEDRQVKMFMKKYTIGCLCPKTALICQCNHKASLKILTPKPIRASGRELHDNPRARSARLRAAQRIPEQ